MTLPTYDELAGKDGMDGRAYYGHVEGLLDPRGLNVLAIHAEVEGIRLLGEFEAFVDRALGRDWSFVPLGELLPREGVRETGRLVRGTVAGREGWVALQASLE